MGNGALKSASGVLPRRGEQVTLKAFLPEVSQFVCGVYCFPVGVHVFVRFDGSSPFRELSNIPRVSYNARGPVSNWENNGVAELPLSIPSGADRIEVYAQINRLTYNGGSCYLAYDQTECPDTTSLPDAYVSNFGRNFSISVR